VPTETSQTLDRGLLVLEVLARAEGGRTVTQIAQELGISRTVVYRLLATLEQHALVRRGVDGRTRPGMALLGLARTVQSDLRDATMPLLRRLAEGAGAVACLWLADGDDIVTVATVLHSGIDGSHATHAPRVGSRRPRGASAIDLAISDTESMSAPRWHISHDDPAAGVTTFTAGLTGVAGLGAAVGLIYSGHVVHAKDVARLGELVTRTAAEASRSLR
jgi:DNA-binding IclR family transcriptional regulator